MGKKHKRRRHLQPVPEVPPQAPSPKVAVQVFGGAVLVTVEPWDPSLPAVARYLRQAAEALEGTGTVQQRAGEPQGGR